MGLLFCNLIATYFPTQVGVLRTSAGALHFFVNGNDQGAAATGLPATVYAVVDMYGKCAQVTIVDSGGTDILPGPRDVGRYSIV